MSTATETLPAAAGHAAPPAAPARRFSWRTRWDLALAFGGLLYVVLILWLSLDTPLLSLLFVALAAHQLFSRRGGASK